MGKSRQGQSCAQFRAKAPFLHDAALLVLAVPTAGKTYFGRIACVAGKGVHVADGDTIVAARRGWPKDWRRTAKQRDRQYRAMYEAYVEHALEYPMIPVIGSAAKGGLPALAAYYRCIVFRAATPEELMVRAAQRHFGAGTGDHQEWAKMTPDDMIGRIEEALRSQEWYASHVDFVFTSWRALADKVGLWIPRSYSEELRDEDKLMAERLFGTLTIQGKTYKVSGDAATVEKAREMLSAAPATADPAAPAPAQQAAPPAEPKEGDIKQFMPKKRGALPDPDRWTGVSTPQEARR